MDPRVQYAHTSDGVSIAYWTWGEGTVIVQTPAIPFSQVQLASQMPEDRLWGEVLRQRRRKLVRFDARGTGLSDRDVTDFSLDCAVRDLEAVVDDLHAETFALWAFVTSGPAAVAYAVLHPERVSHLILWSTWPRTADVLRTPQAQGFLALLDKDWDLFTETAAHAFFGWSSGELAHRAAMFMRDGITPETTKAMIAAADEFDVTDLLPQIRCPTLVIHSREVPFPDLTVSRDLVSQIADARLVVLEGPPAGWEMPPEALRAIDELLGEGEPLRAFAPSPGALVTILFTDIESSTALTQRLGDAAGQELVHAHNTIVREALHAHGGSEIKHTGDGIMASFPSTSGALECAIAIQQAVAAHAGGYPEMPLAVRVGLNAGEPVAEEEDLFGTAVQLARRICDEAQPGEILTSDVVRQLAAGKRFSFADRGSVSLRGFAEPARLHELRWARR